MTYTRMADDKFAASRSRSLSILETRALALIFLSDRNFLERVPKRAFNAHATVTAIDDSRMFPTDDLIGSLRRRSDLVPGSPSYRPVHPGLALIRSGERPEQYGRIAALRDDAFEAHGEGMTERGLAVVPSM